MAWKCPTQESAYGQCAEITQLMITDFPELRRVRGHYYCSMWGKRSHWWCVAPDGSVVDPTAIQFPSRGAGEYVPHEEGSPEPTGKCPNCGGYCYEGRDLCSAACRWSYMAYLNGGDL